jgi:hypothetical protein
MLLKRNQLIVHLPTQFFTVGTPSDRKRNIDFAVPHVLILTFNVITNIASFSKICCHALFQNPVLSCSSIDPTPEIRPATMWIYCEQ